MTWLYLPPIPGTAVIMFGLSASIFVIGMIMFVTERRKEIKKRKAQENTHSTHS